MAYYVAKILNGQAHVIEKNDTSVVRSLGFDFETGDISPVSSYAQEILIAGATIGTTTTTASSIGTNVLYPNAAAGPFPVGEYLMVELDDGRQFWAIVTSYHPLTGTVINRNIPVAVSIGNQIAKQDDFEAATDFTIDEDFKERKLEAVTSNSEHLRTTSIKYENKFFQPIDKVMADISSYLNTARAVTNFEIYSTTGESYTFTDEADLQDLLYQLAGYTSNIIDGENTLVNQIWDAANTQVAMDAIVDSRTDIPPTLTASAFPVVRYDDDTKQSITINETNFTPQAAPAHSQGQVYYDSTDDSLSYQTGSSGVTNNIGKEIFVPPRIKNDQGVAITNGQAVYMSGSDGTYPEVKLAQANAELTSASIGLITETSIADGATGYCTTYGLVRNFNTVSWAAGDILYLSPTVAGGLQNTKPVYPNFATRIGIVLSSSASGTIFCTYPQVETVTGSTRLAKSYSMGDYGATDNNYVAGFYESAAASATLTIGGTVTQVFGDANRALGAHAFCVASGAGGTDLVLTVTGTSITDAGVRTTSDSEIIVADTDAAVTDQYFETSKKWLGQVTYTLTDPGVGGGSFTFNYGVTKYEDFGNIDFTVTDFESIGKSSANAASTNVILYHHNDTGWTYSAGAFSPGGAVICDMITDYSTDSDIDADEYFSYKRTSLSTVVQGSALEGIIVEFVQTTNNSLWYANFHVGILT